MKTSTVNRIRRSGLAAVVAVLMLTLVAPGTGQARELGESLRKHLDFLRPDLISFGFNESVLRGGETITASVGLSKATPFSMSVYIRSSSPAIPSCSISVPGGSASASGGIPTNVVAAPTTVDLTATTDGKDEIVCSVTLLPPELKELELLDAIAYGGEEIRARVKLTGPAPVGGLRIDFTGDSASALPPSHRLVPEGEIEEEVRIPTEGVAQPTDVTVTARSNAGDARSASLVLLPAVLDDLDLDPDSVNFKGNPNSEEAAVGKVTLRGVFTEDVRISLEVVVDVTAWEPLLDLVEYPDYVDIPAGQSEATFPFTFKNPGSRPDTGWLQGYLVASHDGHEEAVTIKIDWY